MELDALLRRERAVVGAAAALLALLAWVYLWQGAGMGMSMLEMTELALFPHAHPESMPGMQAPPFSWSIALAMWWIMMIAMMVPSAMPLILLYGRVVRQATARPASGSAKGVYAAPLFLLAGYLLAWLVFSLLAVTIQYTAQRTGLISEMMLSSRSGIFSGAMLLAAGLYQFSPLKQTCLRQCRGPVYFLTRHWRPGRNGALAMGLRHGAWCVGCCWILMLLLLVGGVMNAVWIALLALLVLVEKLLPGGPIASRLAGGVLIAWAVATLLV